MAPKKNVKKAEQVVLNTTTVDEQPKLTSTVDVKNNETEKIKPKRVVKPKEPKEEKESKTKEPKEEKESKTKELKTKEPKTKEPKVKESKLKEPKDEKDEKVIKKPRATKSKDTKLKETELSKIKKSIDEYDSDVEQSTETDVIPIVVNNEKLDNLKIKWYELSKRIKQHNECGLLLEKENNMLVKEMYDIIQESNPKLESVFNFSTVKSTDSMNMNMNMNMFNTINTSDDESSNSSSDSDDSIENNKKLPIKTTKKKIVILKDDDEDDDDDDDDDNITVDDDEDSD